MPLPFASYNPDEGTFPLEDAKRVAAALNEAGIWAVVEPPIKGFYGRRIWLVDFYRYWLPRDRFPTCLSDGIPPHLPCRAPTWYRI